MAIEYNNIYYQIKQRPTTKCMMVAIPFYMYRIETNEFEHGLNFFQKLVLKFKAKPGIKDETISEYTGLDAKLISRVSSELGKMGLFNEHGSLNDEGKKKIWEIDGLLVKSGKRKIGYAFKYVDQNKLYPYYISEVFPADLINNIKGQHPKILTGTKGDGDAYSDRPFFLDEALKNKENFNRPTEREILQLIQNNKRKLNKAEDEESKVVTLSNQLSIRFLNDQPEIVWTCTYVYLLKTENDTYEPDWRILDPFGFIDNVALKFYLNNPTYKNLLDTIRKEFENTPTTIGVKYSEFHEKLNAKIEDMYLSDFAPRLGQLDLNKLQYIRILIEGKLRQEYSNYQNLYDSKGYHGKIIELFENIFSEDKEERSLIYDEMLIRYNKDYDARFTALSSLWRARIFSNSISVPQYLKSACKGNLKFPQGIGGHLVGFLLTYNIENKSRLYKLFANKIDGLINIIELRNPDSHGKTIKDGLLKPFPKEVVETSYSYVKSFINDYIQHN